MRNTEHSRVTKQLYEEHEGRLDDGYPVASMLLWE